MNSLYVSGYNCSYVLPFIENLEFNLTLSQQSDVVFKIPISATMRNWINKTDENQENCIFLVENTGTNFYTTGIVLGDVFF